MFIYLLLCHLLLGVIDHQQVVPWQLLEFPKDTAEARFQLFVFIKWHPKGIG